MISFELDFHKCVGNFLKERPPAADNSVRQVRCCACNELFNLDAPSNQNNFMHILDLEDCLCPYCKEQLDFYLSLPRFHYSKKKRYAALNKNRPK